MPISVLRSDRRKSVPIRGAAFQHITTVAGRESYDHQLADIVDAIASGRPLPTEHEDFVPNMVAIDAIYRAAAVR